MNFLRALFGESPPGTPRALAEPVVLDNGSIATHAVYYRGAWVAAARIAGDVAPLCSHDGPAPESDPDREASWFYRMEGE